MTRQRADTVLVDLGLFGSRSEARAAILAGRVRADGEPVSKAGQTLDPRADIELAEGPSYVSRGGLKLEHALDAFGLDPTGMSALDVGASTGGFTDCLLQRGAGRVTAVDVGYGQLAWELRNDPRVRVLERTNIRKADPEALGAPFDLAVVDVSFIGLEKVLPVVFELLGACGQTLALVKPQFEAGKGRVGKKGVVSDPAVHEGVLRSVMETVDSLGRVVRGMTWSPVKGPKGNIEFWIWSASEGESATDVPEDVVRQAHEALGG